MARRPKVALQLASTKPALAAQFASGSQTQEIKFAAPVKGRFFCLESLSAFDGAGQARCITGKEQHDQ